MEDVIQKPFPLENKIQKLLEQNRPPPDWKPSGITRDFYLELSRPIVDMALPWQDETGQIIDPFTRFTSAQQTSRFIGACGGLIQSGRHQDLVDACAQSMDKTCSDLANASTAPAAYEFVVKELMLAYMALRSKLDEKRISYWRNCLADYDPEQTYFNVLSKHKPENIHNFCTFAIAGEAFKMRAGIANHEDFIDRYLEIQKDRFTEFGMYRDPNDPMTYDWTARMNLSLMMYLGYQGKHAGFVAEILRRGALTSLLYISSTGEAPFGGRSNQQNFNEATLALICEYEARRYALLGNRQLAGVFKRTAHLAVQSIRRWLTMSPIRFTKNEFLPESEHGREKHYGHYGVYSLLIASQLGFAYQLADDTIPEAPAFCETGGFILNLPDAFHKIFATCDGYHIEIDTRADLHYDATGLGRVHCADVPTELGLSIPIPACPEYLVSIPASLRNVAVGPGWLTPEGKIIWLSDLSEEITGVEVADLTESLDKVQWSVVYTLNLGGKMMLRENYCLTSKGLEVTIITPDSAVQTLIQIPLLETNGAMTSQIKTENRSFTVKYSGHVLKVECISPDSVEQRLESFAVPNRNGIYRIGCFKTLARQITWRIQLK